MLSTAACSDVSDSMAPTPSGEARLAASSTALSSDWIVLFDDSTSDAPGQAKKIAAAKGGTLKRLYQYSVKGFAAKMSDAAAAELAKTPGVYRVERDGIAQATGTTVSATSWGLDRIDQRALPLDGQYTFGGNGSGVRVYIIDSGILTSHQEFESRASGGWTGYTDGYGASDCYGHGTHVAGTVGGATTGVARGVNLISVRVLDCTGYGAWSTIIAGIDWVTQQKKNNPSIPMAANMSIGGGINSSVNDAVARAVTAGVVMAVAAGNSNMDACSTSPASAPSALTVGATDSYDSRASYSNYGSCLDVFAPGTGITSAWVGSNAAYATISGTSMASPHVAGVAASILGANPTYTPAQVRQAIVDSATQNVVASVGTGSPNLLLNAAFGTSSAPLPPPPPPPSDTTTVTPPPPTPAPTPNITMTVSKTKNGKWNAANIVWAGATTTNVDLYRNNVKLSSTANDGQYTDNKLGAGSYSYKVCNAGSSTICSPSASISY